MMKKYIKPEIKISMFNEFIITTEDPTQMPTPYPSQESIAYTPAVKVLEGKTNAMQTKIDFQSTLGFK